jgi:tRNA pseudouridine38-40 synthase
MATRIKLTVAYLGEHFCGWQRQAHGRTVQGELERALSGVTGGHRIAVVGAGRTDAGVHAAGQVAHADLPVAIPMVGLKKALNRVIGPYIRIRSVVPVVASFHARRSALGKVYSYRVQWRSPELPWTGLRTAVVPPISDPRALERAVAMLPGRRDMASFSIPQQMPTERTLYRAWTEDRRNGLILHFVGDGFLRYQVRRMAGAALDVGRGRVELAEFEDLLLRPQPGARVQTAPARGLTLERVFYRDSPRLHLDSE